jgi:hypothetical protein
MTHIIEKIKSYNYLTKVFAINFIFLLFSFSNFFDTLFTWGVLFIAATGLYHLYKLFNNNENNTITSPLLSQEEFDKGNNDFELFFFLTALFCLGLGMYFSLIGLAIFFVAKSVFINNVEKLNEYNLNQ